MRSTVIKSPTDSGMSVLSLMGSSESGRSPIDRAVGHNRPAPPWTPANAGSLDPQPCDELPYLWVPGRRSFSSMAWDGGTDEPIRVALVEDHERTRERLTAWLNEQADMDVVADVASVAAAVDTIARLVPDVAVVDVQLPDGNGVDLCQRIKTISPSTRCIIHTSVEIGPETAQAAGAHAVVLKQLSGNQLLVSIRSAFVDEISGA